MSSGLPLLLWMSMCTSHLQTCWGRLREREARGEGACRRQVRLWECVWTAEIESPACKHVLRSPRGCSPNAATPCQTRSLQSHAVDGHQMCCCIWRAHLAWWIYSECMTSCCCAFPTNIFKLFQTLDMQHNCLTHLNLHLISKKYFKCQNYLASSTTKFALK